MEDFVESIKSLEDLSFINESELTWVSLQFTESQFTEKCSDSMAWYIPEKMVVSYFSFGWWFTDTPLLKREGVS